MGIKLVKEKVCVKIKKGERKGKVAEFFNYFLETENGYRVGIKPVYNNNNVLLDSLSELDVTNYDELEKIRSELNNNK